MGAYFRMSDEILDSPAAIELSQVTHGDHCSAMRVLLFIRLLNYSLSPSKQFVDAQALSIHSGVPIKQAQKVWDVCIKYQILRKVEYGYNAREWMVEHGHIGRYSKTESNKAFSEGLKQFGE